MMNITECKQCRYHFAEFYGSALCSCKPYHKLYRWIEIDETKNIACPQEHDSYNYKELKSSGPE